MLARHGQKKKGIIGNKFIFPFEHHVEHGDPMAMRDLIKKLLKDPSVEQDAESEFKANLELCLNRDFDLNKKSGPKDMTLTSWRFIFSHLQSANEAYVLYHFLPMPHQRIFQPMFFSRERDLLTIYFFNKSLRTKTLVAFEQFLVTHLHLHCFVASILLCFFADLLLLDF